jgi:xylan 1,4-beta-xylosidase
MIRNPVIAGFAPDPSIVRVGGDYFVATSTFEWFPGVALHHSRDLVHWKLIGHALTRRSQLDLRGTPDSGGVWAPSLSHADGRFWLVYGTLRNTGLGRPFKDIAVRLVTAPDILGPWSEPVELNSIGFDPSLFHDDDGRKWVVNIEWDYRKDRPRFGGIVVQEYDPESRRLVGPMSKILTKPVLIEGPNIYKRDGWYYLMLAEGGTGWNHGISMARSRAITGPYELDPQPSVLTARDDYGLAMQKAGHGELVQTPFGEWYLAHLAGRPSTPERRCVHGRETCLQRVEWSADGWLRLAGGGHHPRAEWPTPSGHTPIAWSTTPRRDEFDGIALGPEWHSLRMPIDETWASTNERPGWLRLRGRESLHSLHEQSLLARRLRDARVCVETRLEFRPTHFTQSAGLVCWYDTRHHFYLRVTHEEGTGSVLGVVLTDRGSYHELEHGRVVVDDWAFFHLRADIDHDRLRFVASRDGLRWNEVGPVFDFSKLSDDYACGFTGAMVGVCAQDLGGFGPCAYFGRFSYSV